MTAKYTTPVQIVPDAADIARAGQSGVFISCTVEGNVMLKMPGGNLSVPVVVGANVLHGFEIVGVLSAGTTATAVVSAMR